MNQLSFRKLISPYKFLLLGSLICLIMFSNLGLTVPWMLKIVIDKVLPDSDYSLMYILCIAIIMIYGIRAIVFYFAHYMINYAAHRVLLDVRQKVFKHLQSLSLRFYEEYRTGKLISNVINDVALLQGLIGIVAQTIDKSLIILVIMGLLFFMNPVMALVVLAFMPLQFVNFYYFKTVMRRDNIILRERMSEISANLAETLNGVKVVKSFSKERSESRNFFASLRPTLDMALSLNMKGIYCWIISDVFSLFTLLAVMLLGIGIVDRGSMSIGAFVAFYSYVGMLLAPINIITNQSAAISQGLAGANRIMKLLNTIPEIKEVENPLTVDHIKGKIEFRNVVFGYDDTKRVIDDFTLTVMPGQKVALVGPSGSGKSTISNLLLRFYDIQGGEIAVDGINVKKLQLESYRSKVGVVLQDPFLFSGSIRDNIAYANKEASEAEIQRAASMANVDEFVYPLEKGFNTEVGENGTTLSGGQKQRLAIARAILRNPSILILDEATSALDTVSEFLVQDALDNLMQDKTTIIIAHRLSTIKNADVIVVMQDGKIVQKGKHDDLIMQEGVYRDMYNTQKKAERKLAIA